MITRNKDIRNEKGSIPYWRIAEVLRISEFTLIRWMRLELSGSRKKSIIEAIKVLRDEERLERK